MRFSDSLSASCDHVTRFWPMGCDQKTSDECNLCITSLKGSFLFLSSTFSPLGWEMTTMEQPIKPCDAETESSHNSGYGFSLIVIWRKQNKTKNLPLGRGQENLKTCFPSLLGGYVDICIWPWNVQSIRSRAQLGVRGKKLLFSIKESDTATCSLCLECLRREQSSCDPEDVGAEMKKRSCVLDNIT